MALVCPRCATQNPDGNSFCQACGSPLNAPPPAPAMPVAAAPASPFTEPPAFTTPPAAAYAAPPPPPPAYQSPYYAPASGAIQPPVHRTPWLVIIAVVVVLVLVMAGVGTVLAIGFAHSSNQAASDIKQLSSPSPAGSPSPAPSSSPTPTTLASNPSGSVYYAMYMLTAASNMPAFSRECAPILKGIQWKLK